jgi:hypothetical protein
MGRAEFARLFHFCAAHLRYADYLRLHAIGSIIFFTRFKDLREIMRNFIGSTCQTQRLCSAIQGAISYHLLNYDLLHVLNTLDI